MERDRTSRTRTDDVYAWLQVELLGGVYPSDEQLKFWPPCTRYDASVTLARDVLRRLSEQGLVWANPQIGFQVTPIPEDVELATPTVRPMR
jgi:DNA-binding GntR family transcriptional regulator